MKKIIVDGITYAEEKSDSEISKDFVIVRTESAGVHFGTLEEHDRDIVVLSRARRVWYWEGAATLSQMSVDGVSVPENCKFPCEVEKITLIKVIEIIPCTEKARKSLTAVEVWSA